MNSRLCNSIFFASVNRAILPYAVHMIPLHRSDVVAGWAGGARAPQRREKMGVTEGAQRFEGAPIAQKLRSH